MVTLAAPDRAAVRDGSAVPDGATLGDFPGHEAYDIRRVSRTSTQLEQSFPPHIPVSSIPLGVCFVLAGALDCVRGDDPRIPQVMREQLSAFFDIRMSRNPQDDLAETG